MSVDWLTFDEGPGDVLDGARILVVEDDPRAVRTLERCLLKLGCVVFAATTCEEGRTRAHSVVCDAAVLDFRLPDGDGLDVARGLYSSDTPTASILVTGDQEAWAHVESARTAGIVRFIAKPWAVAELRWGLSLAVRLTRSQRATISRSRVMKATQRSESAVGLVRGPKPSRELARLAAAAYGLSPMQTHVLALLLDGCANKDVSALLKLSPRATRAHVDLVLKKLMIHSRQQVWSSLRNRGIT